MSLKYEPASEQFRLYATWDKPRSFTPGNLGFDPLKFMTNADDAEKQALQLKEVFSLSLALSLSLSHSLSPTHTLSLALSLTHSLSLTHTHTHPLSVHGVWGRPAQVHDQRRRRREAGASAQGGVTTGALPTGPPLSAKKRSYPHAGSACIYPTLTSPRCSVNTARVPGPFLE